jgi:hypothetical protein
MQQGRLNNYTSCLGKDVMYYSVQISLWILQMMKESRIGTDNIKHDLLKFRCELINQGLQFAGQISFLIKSITNLHIKLGVAMQKPCLQSVYKLVEYLKTIKLTFQLNSMFLANTVGCIIQYLQFQALFVIKNAVLKVVGEPTNDTKFDVLSSLRLVENLLRGSGTKNRLNITCLALNFSDPLSTFGPDYLAKLQEVLKHLKTFSDLQEIVEDICYSTFLFWHQSLLPAYLKQISEQNNDQRRVSYVLSFTDDCIETLKEFNQENQLENLNQFDGVVATRFREDVVKKLCNFIEINLRLDFHWNLQVDKFNPFDINNQLNIVDRRDLIRLSPMLLNGRYVNVKGEFFWTAFEDLI